MGGRLKSLGSKLSKKQVTKLEDESLAGSLAWKHHNDEDADAAEFAAGGNMPMVSPGGLSHGQTACEPASWGEEG